MVKQDGATSSVISEESQGLSDVLESTDPGELVPSEGLSYEQAKELWEDDLSRLPSKYQNILHDLCQDISLQEMWPRLDETYRATVQQFYAIDEFNHAYNADDNSWDSVPYNGQVNFNGGQDNDVDHPTSTYPINIYKTYMNAFINIIANDVPGTKFMAFDDGDTRDLDAAAQAECMKKIIEQANDMQSQVRDYAKVFFTDGQLAIYNRYVLDGNRFGWYDEEDEDAGAGGLDDEGNPPEKKPRRPRGGEVSTAFGVNEVRTPINMDRMCDFQWLQLSVDINEMEAKAVYPFKADAIQAGITGPGEFMRDRTFRLAIRQGIRLLNEDADSVSKLVTWQRSWIRASAFLKLPKPDREFLMAVFPNGCFVSFMGDTYCESRNESMDDHWVIRWANAGVGSSRRSVGQPLVPVQDAVIDITDLRMSCYMNLIPTVLIDENLISGESISQQRAEYGTFLPVTRQDSQGQPATPISDGVFVVSVPTIPADLQQFHKDLITDIPAFLTGLFAAAMGGSDPNNETAAGINILASKSRGQQTPYYKQICGAYSDSMLQLVKIAARFRADDEEVKATLPAKGGENNSVTVDLEDLKAGKFVCFPESGDSIPESFDDKAGRVQAWMADAETNPFIAGQLQNPANQAVANKYLGLSEFTIDGQQAREQQLRIINLLMEETLIPTQQFMQHVQRQRMAMAIGVKAGLEPEEAKSALAPFPPDQQRDMASWPGNDPVNMLIFKNQDHASAVKVTKDWIGSDEGWDAAQNNPNGFQNVCANLAMHEQAVEAATDTQAATALKVAQAQEMVKSQAKAAGEVTAEKGKAIIKDQHASEVSTNYRDLGPAQRMQVAKKRGLNAIPDLIGEANEAAEQPTGTPQGHDDSEVATEGQ